MDERENPKAKDIELAKMLTFLKDCQPDPRFPFTMGNEGMCRSSQTNVKVGVDCIAILAQPDGSKIRVFRDGHCERCYPVKWENKENGN